MRDSPYPEADPTMYSLDRRLLAGFALLFCIVAAYALRTADADLWGHLTYGRLCLEQGGSPTTDPYSFTTDGLRWHDHEYLAQMSLWLAYRELGPLGLIFLKTLLGVGICFFVYKSVRLTCDDARVWAPVLLLLVVGVSHWFLFRPQLYTFFFFSLTIWLLFRYLVLGSSPVWVVAAVMPVWVNFHGGFLAGIGAIGLVGLLRLVQIYNKEGFSFGGFWSGASGLGLVLVLAFLGSFINPMGWGLWPYLATELGFSTNRLYIDEWRPVWHSDHVWAVGLMAFTFLVLVAVVALAQARRVMIAGLHPWQWLLSCLPLTYMACQSVRHIPIWTMWVAPILAMHAEAAARSWAGSRLWIWTWFGTVAGTTVPTLMILVFVAQSPEPRISARASVLGSRSPLGASEFLARNDIRGDVYTPLWWGSFLTWEHHPKIRVSEDGRNVTLFSREQVKDNLEFYRSNHGDLTAPLRSGAGYLLVPTDSPILNRVRVDANWQPLYEDADAVLFQKTSSATLSLQVTDNRQSTKFQGPRWFR